MTKIFDDLKQGLAEVDAFLGGQTEGFKVTVPEEINVKEIRSRLKMTQLAFSSCFGFSLDAVKHWEGGRRTPEASARAFLTVIAKNPKAVIAALHAPANNAMTKVVVKDSSVRARKSSNLSTVVTLPH